jgi:hypothetical protein
VGDCPYLHNSLLKAAAERPGFPRRDASADDRDNLNEWVAEDEVIRTAVLIDVFAEYRGTKQSLCCLVSLATRPTRI